MIRELRAIYVKGRGFKLNNADLLRLLEVPEKTPHIEPIKVGTFKECLSHKWVSAGSHHASQGRVRYTDGTPRHPPSIP